MPTRFIFIIGASLIIRGLLMIPLPGPGAHIVGLGLLVTLVGVVVSAGKSKPEPIVARLNPWQRPPAARL
jgi:hypothetical protein